MEKNRIIHGMAKLIPKNMITISKVHCLVILMLASLAFNNIAYAQTVTEKDIYDFYNHLGHGDIDTSMILRKEAVSDYIASVLVDNDLSDTALIIKPIVGRKDKIFMKEQLSERKNFQWSAKQLTNIRVANDDSIAQWKKLDMRAYFARAGNICSSSIPLFSRNKRKCIIYIGNMAGTIYVYRKFFDKWREVRSIRVWVS